MIEKILSRIDLSTASLEGGSKIERRLADLRGSFADADAFDALLAKSNPLLYTVSAIEPESGTGALHYALGQILPGRVGREFFLTKGHLHAWRDAAEVYIGLGGRGMMLLQNEDASAPCAVPLLKDSIVYVPGHTSHRTVNTGDEPLTYLGVYPAASGHDYAPVARTNFSLVVVAEPAGPVVMDRNQFLAALKKK